MDDAARVPQAGVSLLDPYLDGRISAEAALAALALATPDDDVLRHLLLAAAREHPGAEPRLALIARLIADEPGLCTRLRAVASAVPHHDRDADPERLLARIAAGFDAAAGVSPEAAVALHSLGRADGLARSTDEIVDRLVRDGCLGVGDSVLDVGCGIGRFAGPIEAHGAAYAGIDPSARMVETARRRRPGCSFAVGVAHDLSRFPAARFDLVLAVDVYPYVVQAGGDLPARSIAEAARVLRPGGRLAILNYAYRGDPQADRREIADLGARTGLRLRAFETGAFRDWDGTFARLDRGEATVNRAHAARRGP